DVLTIYGIRLRDLPPEVDGRRGAIRECLRPRRRAQRARPGRVRWQERGVAVDVAPDVHHAVAKVGRRHRDGVRQLALDADVPRVHARAFQIVRHLDEGGARRLRQAGTELHWERIHAADAAPRIVERTDARAGQPFLIP